MLVETIRVIVVYPPVVLSRQQLLDLPRLRPQLVRMRRNAEAGQPSVQRFGIAGVFIFVFVPFWMTGPVVGAIIGFPIGLKPRAKLSVVLSATYVAAGTRPHPAAALAPQPPGSSASQKSQRAVRRPDSIRTLPPSSTRWMSCAPS